VAASPHEDPRFFHSVEYTVTLRLRIAGGARFGTADRWGRQVAEKLANAAARMRHVVEVTVTAGESHDGELRQAFPVYFAEANTGPDPRTQPGKLARYVDPDHERALESLAAANAAYRARQHTDRARRRDAGCASPSVPPGGFNPCHCVYCDPGAHDAADTAARIDPDNPYIEYRCVCGLPVPGAGERCVRHRSVPLLVLDGDSDELRRVILARTATPSREQRLLHGLPPDEPRRSRFGIDL
jgi:hypothetical protein